VTGSVNSDGKTGTATQVTFSQRCGGTNNGDRYRGRNVRCARPDRCTCPARRCSTAISSRPALPHCRSATLSRSAASPTRPVKSSHHASSWKLPEARSRVKGIVQSLDMTAPYVPCEHAHRGLQRDHPNGLACEWGHREGKRHHVKCRRPPWLRHASTCCRVSGGRANNRGRSRALSRHSRRISDFVINGQRVTTDANTQFRLDGVTLAVNVPVDVEGTFDASGVLVATSVQATPDDASLVRGLVENVNAASNTLTVSWRDDHDKQCHGNSRTSRTSRCGSSS